MNALFNTIDNNPMAVVFCAIIILGFMWVNSIIDQEPITDDNDNF